MQNEQLKNNQMFQQHAEQATQLQQYKVQIAELSDQYSKMTQKITTQQEQLMLLQGEHTTLNKIHNELASFVQGLLYTVSKEFNGITAVGQQSNLLQQLEHFQHDIITKYHKMQTLLQEHTNAIQEVEILQVRMKKIMDMISNEVGFSVAISSILVSEQQFEHNMKQIQECLHKFAKSKQEEISLVMKVCNSYKSV